MPHKTPSFWYPKPDEQKLPLKAKLLNPLSCLYSGLFKLHHIIKHPKKVNIPVVCVGNLSAGGTGKTPTCLSLISLIKDSGVAANPFFLMRGYGGAERGPLLVDPQKHNAWDVGDEALILSRGAPTVVSADRVDGAKLAARHGADMVIMDDGLQNPGIHKDIKIIVINGEMGFGNKLTMPAGPLREPLESGLQKADAFLMIGEDKTAIRGILPSEKPVFTAILKADPKTLPPKDKSYFAFAGLGYPEKFFNFLRDDLGYTLADTRAFADHCPYSRSDLQALRSAAKSLGATLITTQKDFLRLPHGYKENIVTLPVFMQFSEDAALRMFLKTSLNRSGATDSKA